MGLETENALLKEVILGLKIDLKICHRIIRAQNEIITSSDQFVGSVNTKFDAQFEGLRSQIMSQAEEIGRLSDIAVSASDSCWEEISARIEAEGGGDKIELMTKLKDANIENLKLKRELIRERKTSASQRQRADDFDALLKQLRPLAFLGEDVRLRNFEWAFAEAAQNEEYLDAGTRASRHGCAAGDAIVIARYHKPERYERSYFSAYGFGSAVVRQLLDCPIFVRILDWRGSMKKFLKSRYRKSWFHADFVRVFMMSPLGKHLKDEECKDKVDISALNDFLQGNFALNAIRSMETDFELERAINKSNYKKKTEQDSHTTNHYMQGSRSTYHRDHKRNYAEYTTS
ncbi:hypothetical protein BDZ45DRAFT_749579 [Acephala macrosclerotiorum]|nr:hypothetical protein BDZ45DRAFT_749579 [Acephala macrosclerotiorum]